MQTRRLDPLGRRYAAAAPVPPDGVGFHAAMCQGRLQAIGGWLPASAGTSWLPRNAEGWFPVACYLLRSGSDALLIDTGLAMHRPMVELGMERGVGAQAALDIVLTRREPDTLMNLPWIARRYKARSVRCSGPVDPFDYVERMEEAMTAAQMRAIAGIPVEFLVPSTTLSCGEFQLELIKPPIRVLATDWFYERATGTLFSSDMWAFVAASSSGEGPICRIADERISVERIADHLRAKFDWLEGIDTDPIARQLAGDLAGRLMERICPNYGCVVEGSAVVAELFSNTLEALARLKR